MEAKDTVMDMTAAWDYFHPVDALEAHDLSKLLKRRAEISFKAGEKKVVEWIKTHSEDNYPEHFRGLDNPRILGIVREYWREFLKSEGIE